MAIESRSGAITKRAERTGAAGRAIAALSSSDLLQLAIALHVAAAVIAVLFVQGDFNFGSVNLYLGYGQNILAGQVPFRDFQLEYPAFSTILFAIPALVARDPYMYRAVLAVQMLLFDLIGTGIGLWAIRRLQPGLGAWGVVLVQPLLFIIAGPSIMLTRFDMAPAVITLAAIALWAARRERWGWLLLGIATALKLYPILLAPFMLMLEYRRGDRRSIVVNLVILAAAIVVPSAIITRGDIPAIIQFAAYHEQRGLEIESLWSSLLMSAGLILNIPGYSHLYQFGSEELTGPYVSLLTRLSLPLTAAGLLVIYFIAWRYFRRRRDPANDFQTLLELGAAAMICFMVFSKVLSPQYLVWLYPLAAVWGKRREMVWVWLGSMLLLGLYIFPYHWNDLYTFKPIAVIVLLLRNVELIALGVILLVPYIRTSRSDPSSPNLVLSD